LTSQHQLEWRLGSCERLAVLPIGEDSQAVSKRRVELGDAKRHLIAVSTRYEDRSCRIASAKRFAVRQPSACQQFANRDALVVDWLAAERGRDLRARHRFEVRHRYREHSWPHDAHGGWLGIRDQRPEHRDSYGNGAARQGVEITAEHRSGSPGPTVDRIEQLRQIGLNRPVYDATLLLRRRGLSRGLAAGSSGWPQPGCGQFDSVGAESRVSLERLQ